MIEGEVNAKLGKTEKAADSGLLNGKAVGSGIGDLVALQDAGDGTPTLPPIDARNLVNAPGGGGDADTLNGQAGAHYLDRANHIGTQPIASISGVSSFAQTMLDDEDAKAARATLDARPVGATVNLNASNRSTLQDGESTIMIDRGSDQVTIIIESALVMPELRKR